MHVVFNILIIGLVAFIAYWLANQGVFSAILHLLCVIVAGAIALAIWEPLAFAALVKGSSGFSNYGWGVTLILSFALLMFLLRLALDRLAPANVKLPNWANLAFGLPIGAAAGILTLGIFVIGAGFVQASDSLIGFRGWARGSRSGNIESINTLWLPVHKFTDDFYSWLSVTSMSTPRPLRHYYPELYKQATLIRDSYKGGTAALAMAPEAVNVRDSVYCPDLNRCAVAVGFNEKARDYGDQLTLSRSQIRLIGAARGTQTAAITYPDRWRQDTVNGIGYHTFENDVTAYITNVPARETADVNIQFPAPAGGVPRFIQIRGTRFDLNPRLVDEAGWVEFTGKIENFDSFIGAAGEFTPQNIQSALEITNTIRNLNVGTNSPFLAGIELSSERFFKEGEASFPKVGGRPPRALAVQGIYEPQGTKVILLDVSQESPANIFGPVAQLVTDDAKLALVDSNGRRYSPLGYVHLTIDKINLKLEPRTFLKTIDQVPAIPRSGGQTLRLVFRITQGVTIVSFEWGNQTVGTCNLPVT